MASRKITTVATTSIRKRRPGMPDARVEPAPEKASSKKNGTLASRTTVKSVVADGNNRKAKRKAEEPESYPGMKARKIKYGTSPPPCESTPNQESRKVNGVKSKVPRSRAAKPKVILNQAPTELLSVYVFGTNEGGELGLGAGFTTDGFPRPRLNPNLSSTSAGVVQLSTGAMHCAALTHDNKILTWGINDLGALGRDTEWDGGWVEPDGKNGQADQNDSDSDTGLNPREATPIAVEASCFPTGTTFAQLAAGDSTTFALTDDGLVYGWGTLRATDGESFFSPGVKIQKRPVLVPMSQKVIKIAAGSNHALALTSKGAVLAWGIGEHNQLGRRHIDRYKWNGLVPQTLGLPKDIVIIGVGANHSFAVRKNGDVYSWGLNNYGQTGIIEMDGEDLVNILHPRRIDSLKKFGTVKHIEAGNFHSIAVTDQGACVTWGRVDTYVTGLSIENIPPQHLINNERGQAKILKVASRVPGIDATFAAAGGEHSIAVARDGKAYSWGFNQNGQTGQGIAEDEIKCATQIESNAVRGKTMVWAGGAAQFSVLAGKEASMVNGAE